MSNIWKVTGGDHVAYVQCPSKSGAKVFARQQYLIPARFALSAERVTKVPWGERLHSAFFERGVINV